MEQRTNDSKTFSAVANEIRIWSFFFEFFVIFLMGTFVFDSENAKYELHHLRMRWCHLPSEENDDSYHGRNVHSPTSVHGWVWMEKCFSNVDSLGEYKSPNLFISIAGCGREEHSGDRDATNDVKLNAKWIVALFCCTDKPRLIFNIGFRFVSYPPSPSTVSWSRHRLGVENTKRHNTIHNHLLSIA